MVYIPIEYTNEIVGGRQGFWTSTLQNNHRVIVQIHHQVLSEAENRL